MSNGTTDPNATDPNATNTRAEESALSSWAGPYVTEMLGRGWAAAATPYTAYQGPLTAGASDLQQRAYQGLGALNAPTAQMGAYTPGTFTDSGVAQAYMNPYMQMALDPQMNEARRQAQIEQQNLQSRYGKAGAYGGGRQAVAEAELSGALQRNLANIYGTGMEKAYTQGMGQFNTEEQRRRQAQQDINQFGMDVLNRQQTAGAEQRAIEGEGIAADRAQFEEERDWPYRQATYMHSLLGGLPLQTQSYSYYQPSGLENIMNGIGSAQDLWDLIKDYFP